MIGFQRAPQNSARDVDRRGWRWRSWRGMGKPMSCRAIMRFE